MCFTGIDVSLDFGDTDNLVTFQSFLFGVKQLPFHLFCLVLNCQLSCLLLLQVIFQDEDVTWIAAYYVGCKMNRRALGVAWTLDKFIYLNQGYLLTTQRQSGYLILGYWVVCLCIFIYE